MKITVMLLATFVIIGVVTGANVGAIFRPRLRFPNLELMQISE